MKSIVSNKKADMTAGTVVALIISVAIIAMAVYFIIYPTQFKTMIQNILPDMKGKANQSYGVIEGKDELTDAAKADVTKYDNYIAVSDPKGVDSKIGIRSDKTNFDGRFYIFDDAGMSAYYLKDNNFASGKSMILYTGEDEAICAIIVGKATPISECEVFMFDNKNTMQYFTLGGSGQFMFFETMDAYNKVLNG